MDSCLDKYVLVCFEEGVLVCLDGGVVTCLDNNNKYAFDVYFFVAHPLV